MQFIWEVTDKIEILVERVKNVALIWILRFKRTSLFPEIISQ